jgi:DNA-binding winged helix-turn-helix (wHTH) protein
MENPAPAVKALQFGLFELDLQAGELRKSGVKIKLQEQPFQILIALLQKPGEVVTREELRKKLWNAETFVDFEHSLGTAINKIREALGDSAENPRFVETLPRRGYRFIAQVNERPRDARSPATTGESDHLQAAKQASSKWQPLWLRLAAGIAAAFVIAIFGWGIGRHRVGAGASHPSIRSLAVLPLANLSNDPEQESLPTE